MDKQQPTHSTMQAASPEKNYLRIKGNARQNLSLLMLQFYFQVVGQALPTLAGALAYKLWFSTQRFPIPRREQKWQESARTYTLDNPFGPLMVYVWGEDMLHAPNIVLLHGWNGRATQMGSFVDILLQAGFRVTAFDAPGHGLSPGNSTDILKVSNALQTVVDSLGSVDTVIAHSFGAMALTYALRNGLDVQKAVCISPPADASTLFDSFCSSLHIPHRTQENLLNRFHQQFGEDIWKRISTTENARRLSIPVLIIHDENDRDVQISHSRKLAKIWPGAQLMVTQGLGHRRILRHEHVLQAIKDFVTNSKT